MKKDKYILFTSGRGPIECALAVQGVQAKFRKYLNSKNIDFEIVAQKNGPKSRSMETIVFKVFNVEQEILNSWIGTIQWICKSPVRKFHKRKNWFIKCIEVEIPEKTDLNIKDVKVQSFRASGPGGQHRNKVETAIRLIHKASGIIVTASDGKSQSQNKKKAWTKLIAKLEMQNKQIIECSNNDQWTSQIVIERGRAIKTFSGIKFNS